MRYIIVLIFSVLATIGDGAVADVVVNNGDRELVYPISDESALEVATGAGYFDATCGRSPSPYCAANSSPGDPLPVVDRLASGVQRGVCVGDLVFSEDDKKWVTLFTPAEEDACEEAIVSDCGVIGLRQNWCGSAATDGVPQEDWDLSLVTRGEWTACEAEAVNKGRCPGPLVDLLPHLNAAWIFVDEKLDRILRANRNKGRERNQNYIKPEVDEGDG